MDEDDLKREIESPLAGDDNTPFSPADDVLDDETGDPFDRELEEELDKTHPATDTNIQPEEAYDEGESGAAEASEPNQTDTVIHYKPQKDSEQDGRPIQ